MTLPTTADRSRPAPLWPSSVRVHCTAGPVFLITIYMLERAKPTFGILQRATLRLIHKHSSLQPIGPLHTARMSSNTADVPMAPRKVDEDVWSYPRPPLLQRVPNKLQVIWFHPPSSADGSGASGERRQTVIAETTDALRVCETSHPPTYYLPPSSLLSTSQSGGDGGVGGVKLEKTGKRSFCEWKGQATYYTLTIPAPEQAGGQAKVENRIWSYDAPTQGFKPLKGYLSFYASSSATSGRGQEGRGEWRCFVDGEEVGIQEGWVSSLSADWRVGSAGRAERRC